MNRKRANLIAIAIMIVGILLTTGCARKEISVSGTGSVKVEGTNWYRFCDGPNAVMWTKGISGDSDEIEAYVYEHWACAPDFYGDEAVPTTEEDPARGDDDGILEDED